VAALAAISRSTIPAKNRPAGPDVVCRDRPPGG
jgi:hypothetical protein